MAVLLDTGILYAYYDRRDSWQDRARQVPADDAGAPIVPSPVIPEVDHLLAKRLGALACTTFYSGLADGSFFVVDLPRDGYSRVLGLN